MTWCITLNITWRHLTCPDSPAAASHACLLIAAALCWRGHVCVFRSWLCRSTWAAVSEERGSERTWPSSRCCCPSSQRYQYDPPCGHLTLWHWVSAGRCWQMCCVSITRLTCTLEPCSFRCVSGGTCTCPLSSCWWSLLFTLLQVHRQHSYTHTIPSDICHCF